MKSLAGKWIAIITFLAFVAAPFGCSNHDAYQKAFDAQSALTHNQCTFTQAPESIFVAVKEVFTRQGFTIKSADQKSGIITAVRNMPDKKDKEISYTIAATANISEVGGETNVSLAASQQTVLHKATTTWWHLLWIIPIIPTGTEYQTLVINEGDVTDPATYTDFFNSCKIAVTKYEQAIKAAAIRAADKAEAEKAAAERKEQLKREKEAATAAAEKAAAEQAAEEQATTKTLADKSSSEEQVVNNDQVDKTAAANAP